MPIPRELKCLVRVETRFLRQYRRSHLYFQLVGSKVQLSYAGHECKRIPSTLCKMFGNQVECLDLSFNSITSLSGLQDFPKLKDLILDNNKLKDLNLLPTIASLTTLSMNKNCITDLDEVLTKIQTNLPNLTYLSMLGNPVCPDQLTDLSKTEADYQRYRLYVIFNLQSLTFLDSRRISRKERAEAKLRGKFLYIRKPKDSHETIEYQEHHAELPLLPMSRQEHKGAYGKCLYLYSGKHSEGNRFIRNNDL